MADESLFEVLYVPPAPPPPGRFIVRPRELGTFPTLHLSPEAAFALWTALGDALEAGIKDRS